jgi:hypothetical protein
MTLLSPSENSKIEYSMGLVRISIPSQKNPQQLFLRGVWLLFWLLVLTLLVMIDYQGITDAYEKGTFDFSSICMLLLWALGALGWGLWGSFTANIFLWQLGGLETIEASHNVLRIRRSVFGIGRTKVYEPYQITSIKLGTNTTLPIAFLKFESASFDVPAYGSILVGLKGNRMEFTDRLGLGLRPEEAEKVVKILQQQLFPNHA